jgi:hypothetical protein
MFLQSENFQSFGIYCLIDLDLILRINKLWDRDASSYLQVETETQKRQGVLTLRGTRVRKHREEADY